MKAKKWMLSGFLALFFALMLAGCNPADKSTDSTGDIGGEPHTHVYGQWEVTKEAICTEKGEQQRSCACGASETQAIEMIEHSFGQWEEKTAATCTGKGVQVRSCACGATEERDIEKLGHDYGEWEMTSVPSVTEEGKLERVCKHDATHVEIQKILKTPSVSYSAGIIAWEAVENATAYDLYIDDVLTASVADVCYVKATEAGAYAVVARTDSELYRAYSEMSNAVMITYGQNSLLAGNIQSLANISDIWRFNIANFSGKTVQMLEKDGKTALRLSANAAATIAVGGGTIRPNTTVTVEFDVKVEGADNGIMNIGLYYEPAWQIPLTDVQIPEADESGWAHVRYDFTYGENVPADAAWANFDIRYVCEEVDGNSAYIANFRIMQGDTQIDTANFCSIKLDGAMDTWYLEFLKYGTYSENEIVFEGENAILKLTSTNSSDSSFIMASGDAFGAAGTYKVSMKVKLGSGATAAGIGNIGFEIQSDGTPNAQFEEFAKNAQGDWDFTQDAWTTIETYVTIEEKNCSWINLRFYFFTNNDMYPSADNYLLVDDITIEQQAGGNAA